MFILYLDSHYIENHLPKPRLKVSKIKLAQFYFKKVYLHLC